MRTFLVWFLLAVPGLCQEKSITIATLNCYWFFNAAEGRQDLDKPRTTFEYNTKAEHLIALLPKEAPLFVGFQEIGGRSDLELLAKSASTRYQRAYQALFVTGDDLATGQNVGAILDCSHGWGVGGLAARAPELERELSKHLAVRLTNAVTSLDICLVQLRAPILAEGIQKQREQCRALLDWATRRLSAAPLANLIILGDFNETQPVGSEEQSLSALFQAQPPMVDALATFGRKASTDADGKAYDRILVSSAIAKGLNTLKLERVSIEKHRHGNEQERRFYTDHFPVVAVLKSSL